MKQKQIFLRFTEADLQAIGKLRLHKQQPISNIVRDAVIDVAANLDGKRVRLDDGEVAHEMTIKVEPKSFTWMGFLDALRRIQKARDLSQPQAVRFALHAKVRQISE